MKFRQYHLSTVLKSFESQKIPLDAFLSHYFRSHKAIGSKDRHFIGETIYHYIRWKNLFDYLHLEPSLNDLSAYLDNSTIPAYIRDGMPLPLHNLLCAAYGAKTTREISQISNTRAPLTIRANLLKTTRDHLLRKLSSSFQLSPCPHSPWGIQLHERVNFFTLPEFKEGLFEVQDEASQLAAQLVRTKPKEHVLDYCAGAGGKTLAFAPLLNNTGQIYLHDTRSHALQEARKRLSRAGIQNVQFGVLKRHHQKMDWVVVDVPCSGSGTFRRNPDLKWKFNPDRFENLLQEQREIFKQALAYLHPAGTIVYMTCSLLPQENEAQIAHFQREFDLVTVEKFQTLPVKGGMDGFFAASLKKNTKKSTL